MSSSSSPSLRFEPHRGPGQRWALYLLVGAAAGAPWLIPALDVRMSTGVTLGSVAAMLAGLWRVGWLGARYRLYQVIWDSAGSWWLVGRHGRQVAELRPDSVAFGQFLWLRWNCLGGTDQVLILRGEMPADDWRRWLTRLRLEAGAASSKTLTGAL